MAVLESSGSLPSLGGPVLRDEDYKIPSDGIGLTGHERKVQLGFFYKDDGTSTSRIAHIVRQAKATPGRPDDKSDWIKMGHDDWTGATSIHGGYRFAKSDRGYKSLNKAPPPDTYESKDIATGTQPLQCSDRLSQNPRITFGKMSTGKRRSFLDAVIKKAGQTGAPGQEDLKHHARSRMDIHSGTIDFKEYRNKDTSRKQAVKDSLAPNAYQPDHAPVEERHAAWIVPKCATDNFVAKSVKSTMLYFGDGQSRTRQPQPGPGAHDLIDPRKVSRGTKLCQIRGLSRSSVSGYF